MQIQLLFVTIFFSLCLAANDYEMYGIDLKDGEYGYKIYYDDGAYDFEDNTDQEEQETDGLCSLVHPTNKDIQYRNDKALEKMEKYMEIYVLANSLRDYAQFVKTQINNTNISLTVEVNDAVESALRDHIDIEDLTYLYKTLVAIPDKYQELDTEWKDFVIFQLESVKDYIGEHFQQFKRELAKLKTSRQFYKRRNFYVNLADRGGLMSLFYNWFDSRVCKPRMYDEAQIREQLKEHLKHVIGLPERVDSTETAKDSEKDKSEPKILNGEGQTTEKESSGGAGGEQNEATTAGPTTDPPEENSDPLTNPQSDNVGSGKEENQGNNA